MGSLNDYGGGRRFRERDLGKKRVFPQRLLRQSGLALVLFLLVAAGITADNLWGQGARYVAGDGLAPGNSWINFGGAETAGAPLDSVEPAVPVESNAGSVADSAEEPRFTAPASGVVVTELDVPASGFATEQGILIQGSAGQTVKAAADAEVLYLGESEDGYIVELTHSGGFTSVYQGLSQVDVTAGQQLTIGQAIGVTESGEVTFSLLKDNVEVSPLEYLFQ